MVGFQGERPADRLPGQPCARWRVQLREQGESSGAQERVSRERTARWRVVLNSPIWPCPQAADRIRVSVWGGAPPMSMVSTLQVL